MTSQPSSSKTAMRLPENSPVTWTVWPLWALATTTGIVLGFVLSYVILFAIKAAARDFNEDKWMGDRCIHGPPPGRGRARGFARHGHRASFGIAAAQDGLRSLRYRAWFGRIFINQPRQVRFFNRGGGKHGRSLEVLLHYPARSGVHA